MSTTSPSSGGGLFSKKGVLFDACATLGFAYWITGVLAPHVPVQKEPWHTYLAVYAATCVAGVFWLGLQCLRATWVDQRRRAQEVKASAAAGKPDAWCAKGP